MYIGKIFLYLFILWIKSAQKFLVILILLRNTYNETCAQDEKRNYTHSLLTFCRMAAQNRVTGRSCISRRFSGLTRESGCCWSVRRKGSPTLPFCSMWRALPDTAVPTSGQRVSRTFCSAWSCRHSCRNIATEAIQAEEISAKLLTTRKARMSAFPKWRGKRASFTVHIILKSSFSTNFPRAIHALTRCAFVQHATTYVSLVSRIQ